MTDDQQATSIRIAVPAILAALQGLLWIVLLVVMWRVVPSFIRTFEDFDADLPTITRWVVWFSDIWMAHWYLLLPVCGALCATHLVVLYALYAHPNTGVLRWLWSALMLSLPLGLLGWIALAVYLPWSAIMRQLG